MRRLLFAAALFMLIISCKNRDESAENRDVGSLKIDSVKLAADTMSAGSTLVISTYSTMSSGCESFYKYRYTGEGFARNISASRLKTGAVCGRNAAAASQFSFSPKTAGRYTLKFWSGGSPGAEVWIEKTVLVK